MVNGEILINAGIDMDSLLKRLMGNETLVRVFVQKFAQDRTIDTLNEAFVEKNVKTAEMASHTLKGMCGNLSLTELYELFSAQVAFLRSGEFEKAETMMPGILESYQKTIDGINQFLNEK